MIRPVRRIVVKENLFEVGESHHIYLNTSFFLGFAFERLFHALPNIDTATWKVIFPGMAHLEEKQFAVMYNERIGRRTQNQTVLVKYLRVPIKRYAFDF